MRSTTVSQTGTGQSVALPINRYVEGVGTGLFTKVTGTATYTIECTPDNVQDPTITPVWYPVLVPALTGATQNANGLMQVPAEAVRVNVASGSGIVVLVALVQGLQ
jgi:hypothetical protein